MIPRFKPWLGWAEFKALFRRNKGAVEQFEQEFAKAFEATEAVAFPYGRSALWAFLRAVGVHDAEVVLPAYTCSVVAHAVTLSGNRPRFVDIRLDDYNMDLDRLPEAINQDTRAIVATHLFGYPLDLDRLEGIRAEAEERFGHRIWLIQDCAHSFGATWKGRLVGASGDVALYGLNISKMMTSIFGGMLTFRDPNLAAAVRGWRDEHFQRPPAIKGFMRRGYLLAVYAAFSDIPYGLTWWLQHRTPLLDRLTKSYHLDDQIRFPPDHLDLMQDVEAAVGLEQLKRYPEIIRRRRSHAKFLSENLGSRPRAVLPPIVEGATYSHYVVRVADRPEAVLRYGDQGVEIGELIQYSVPELPCYGGSEGSYPNSLHASKTTVNLPIYPAISSGERRRLKRAWSI
jgi:perosamine synthetase